MPDRRCTEPLDTEQVTVAVPGLVITPSAGGSDTAGPFVPAEAIHLSRFGPYRIVRACGRGGMGTVYEAVDTTLGRTVALKLMHPAVAAHPASRERFLREARAVASLRHENVVTLFHVGEQAGVPFLVTEFLTGVDLAEHARGGLAVAEVVRLGREIAAGLAAAHAAGVVHRDIKPENVWIEHPTGRVRLLDFGLAWVGGFVPIRGPDDGDYRLTGAGDFVGTPGYVPPEQLRGEGTDFRADLFALGAVLYRLVVGRPAFPGNSVGEILRAQETGAIEPVAQHRPDVPLRLANLIERLLASRPDDRPESAAVVEQELLAIGTGLLADSVQMRPMPTDDSEPNQFTQMTDAAVEPAPVPVRSAAKLAVLVVGVCVVVGASVALVLAVRPVPPTGPGRSPRVVASPTAPAWPPPGFASLFDGNSLAGWHAPAGQPINRWAVVDAVLVASAGGKDQVLLSDREYTDYDLRLEYRWTKPGGHTNILLRAWEKSDGTVDGLRLNIGDDEGFPAVHGRDIGGLYRTGMIQFVTTGPPSANRPVGEWNSLRVVAKRQRIEVTLNGVPMPVADLDMLVEKAAKLPAIARSKGAVGLMAHWGTAEYRKLAVRPLSE